MYRSFFFAYMKDELSGAMRLSEYRNEDKIFLLFFFMSLGIMKNNTEGLAVRRLRLQLPGNLKNSTAKSDTITNPVNAFEKGG